MKYDIVRDTLPQEIQFGAAILTRKFQPKSGEIAKEDVFASTTGGFSFKDTITYGDMFEGIDNVPAGTKEGKFIDYRDVSASGTFVSITLESAKSLMASADIGEDGIKITPTDELKDEDFDDFWIVGDYSVKNGAGGFMAIHMMNVLSQDGFSWQTTNKGKGQFAFNYKAHYSITDIKKVPYEAYIGTAT